jgi:RHS repeat-associated protein
MESTQPILRCRYSYDPLDRLISQFEPDTPIHQSFYCKNRLTTEIQGAVGYSIAQHEDLLLAQQKSQGDARETSLLATDLQRSVLNSLKTNNQRQPIAYSPYGHRTAESGLTSLLGFNGERQDPVTGHYILGNGYRAFNPVLMRFISPDSVSPFGEGGLNPYAYCKGDPINHTDNTGHTPVLPNLKFQIIASKVQDMNSIKFARKLGSTQSPKVDLENINQSTRFSGRLEKTYAPVPTKMSDAANRIESSAFSTRESPIPIANSYQPATLKALSIKTIIGNKELHRHGRAVLPKPLKIDIERAHMQISTPHFPHSIIEELVNNPMFIRRQALNQQI